jgi:hypothetical protein
LFLDDDADTVRRPEISVENPAWREDRHLSTIPPDTAFLGAWKIARSVDEAIELLDTFGLPTFVSFDHDLCDLRPEYTGLKVADEIVARDMVSGSLPENFAYEVHSWNPEGGPRIVGLLNGYLAEKSSGHVRVGDPINSLSREDAYLKLFGSD